MQLILSVDITAQPTRLTVLQVEAKRLKVVEQQLVPLPNLSSFDSFGRTPVPSEVDMSGEALLFKEALSRLKQEWTTSVLLVAPAAYLSLNLDLPFVQPKLIKKVIDMEVQDIVPFDTAEFLLHPAIVGQSTVNKTGSDVHVSATPRAYLGEVLEFFKRCNFDPFIITTPSAAVGALFHLAPEYLARNGLIIFPQAGKLNLTFAFNGTVRQDRTIGPIAADDSNTDAISRSELLSELKLTVHAAEKRYGRRIERAYVIGSDFQPQELQGSIGREVERIRLSDFAELNEEASGLAAICAIFARDDNPPAILTNFRTQEFTYRPHLAELFNGLRSLAPYLVATALLFMITLSLLYALKEQRVTAIRAAMRNKLVALIPNIEIMPGNELGALGEEIGKLNSQLSALGSQSGTSALDALAVFSEDLPTDGGIEVQSIDIRGSRAIITGTAGDYGAVDLVKSALTKGRRKRRDIYCEIRKRGTPSQGGKVRFSFQVTLCE